MIYLYTSRNVAQHLIEATVSSNLNFRSSLRSRGLYLIHEYQLSLRFNEYNLESPSIENISLSELKKVVTEYK